VPNYSIKKLKEIERRTNKQKRLRQLAGKIKEKKWEEFKWKQKPSKEFKIYFLSYPFAPNKKRYRGIDSKKEKLRLERFDYGSKIRNSPQSLDAILNPNSILVVNVAKKNLQTWGNLEKLKDKGRLFTFDEIDKIKNKLKGKDEIKLIASGKEIDGFVSRSAGILARKLKLKHEQIKLDSEKAPKDKLLPLGYLNFDFAFDHFRKGYGKKLTKKEFKKIFNLHKIKLLQAKKEWEKKQRQNESRLEKLQKEKKFEERKKEEELMKKKLKSFEELREEWSTKQRREPTKKDKALLKELLQSIKKFHSLRKVHNRTSKINEQLHKEGDKMGKIEDKVEGTSAFLNYVEQKMQFDNPSKFWENQRDIGGFVDTFHSQMEKKISHYSLPQKKIVEEFQKIFKDESLLKIIFKGAPQKDIKLISKSPSFRDRLSKNFLKNSKILPFFLDFKTKKLSKERFARWINYLGPELKIKEEKFDFYGIPRESYERFPRDKVLEFLEKKEIEQKNVFKPGKINLKEKPENVLEIGPGKAGIGRIKKWAETGKRGTLTFVETENLRASSREHPSIRPEDLEKAAVKYQLKNVKVRAGDATKLGYRRGHYDHIIIKTVLSNLNISGQKNMLYNLKPALRKGGKITITDRIWGKELNKLIRKVFDKKNYAIDGRSGYWDIRKKEKGEK